MSRIPIRLRVAAAFAVAMAVVLGASGWYLYTSLGNHLSHALDRELRVRADDLTAVVGDPDASLASATNVPFVERGESYAELVAANGAVFESTPPLGQDADPDRRGPPPGIPRLDQRAPGRASPAWTSRLDSSPCR